ncbi:MAG: metallophosphatase family protein [Acidobacteria bacterium]|nr:metallophosphatase family protein [Acidobacteriota bacterium]
MRIGILSDTHGRLDSIILEIFQGVDRILHAGDIGGEEMLAELSCVAPVTAVHGNTDGFSLVSTLKASEILEFQPERIVLTHQIGHPERLSPEASELLKEFRPTLVVFGHTHAPFDRVVGGVRFLNPGAAGPRRFSLPRTVALLELGHPKGAQVRFVTLDETSEALFNGGRW